MTVTTLLVSLLILLPWQEASLKDIKPEGWIKSKLETQKTGLSGHPEALSYPYNTCLWAGEIPRMGNHGQDWWRYEQTAYYTDGLLRLGYLLNDKAFIDKGEAGINYTLEHQWDNGRLGPKEVNNTWPFAVFFRAMKAAYDVAPKASTVEALAKHYRSIPMKQLVRKRDILSLEGMLWVAGISGDKYLVAKADSAFRLREELLSGVKKSRDDRVTPEFLMGEKPYDMHGVTMSEMLKLPIMLYAATGNEWYKDLAVHSLEKLYKENGLPDGLFTSAEWLKGLGIEHSHETCNAIDMGWTLGYYLEILKEAHYADMMEKILFNAGFGSVTEDFRALQYYSSVNQFLATGTSNHNKDNYCSTWMAYRPTHQTECCAGNIHRLLPNYAARMWLRGEGEAIAALYGPSSFRYDGKLTFIEETEYPYGESIVIKVKAKGNQKLKLTLRIPGWCEQGSLTVNGKDAGRKLAPGSFVTLDRAWKNGDKLVLNLPAKVRKCEAFGGGVWFERGPIVYSYAIPAEYKKDTVRYANMNGKYPADDKAFPCWDIRPSGPWNFAVASDAQAEVSGNRLTLAVWPIKWDYAKGPNGEKLTPSLPATIARTAPLQHIELVPYGSTTLRLTVFPVFNPKNDPSEKDWPRYSFYEGQNKLVKNKPVAVLFGDSITQNWVRFDSPWLSEHEFIGRGISGQTTMHMLSRFRQDVIELEPKYVAILAGINDIARNNGRIKVENIFKNLVTMVELAKLHGIKPIMCTVLPAGEIGWRRYLGDPRPSIDSLNTKIRAYAVANDILLADYHDPMATEDGALRPEFRTDAVHPNKDGYKVMEEILLTVMAQADRQDTTSAEAPILTPPAPASPRVNGAKVFGLRPGAPFLYRIPVTGERPMKFEVKGLPEGLKLDADKGIISGSVKKEGDYIMTLCAENAKGRAERQFRLTVGEDICLTPPLGWNSWNVWGNSVSQDKVARAARALVESGLADCGWSYINIDDGWQGIRGGKYNAIQTNTKFPDMKALADEIHSYGLRFGIYSGPWVGTYAGHIGSSADHPDGTVDFVLKGQVDSVYKLDRKKYDRKSVRYFGKYSFVDADAKQWADWGVDYLKYDWFPNDVQHAKEMADALGASGRDIVLSLSNHAPLALASSWQKLAQVWRTTDDIRDTWASMSRIGFDAHLQWAPFCGPGHWPDADMLIVGQLGWGPKVRQTRLTPDEQYSHMSLWALLASPMLLGCDLEKLDAFTLGLLSNTEVLDVNQDPLGVQASRLSSPEGTAVFVKPLEDGSVAVGVFNTGDQKAVAGFRFADLGLYGKLAVRDIWRQRDLGVEDGSNSWKVELPSHGVMLLKISNTQ